MNREFQIPAHFIPFRPMSAFCSTGMPYAEGDPDKRDQNKCVQQLPNLDCTWVSQGQASGKCHQISQMRLPWGRGRDSVQVECSLRGWVYYPGPRRARSMFRDSITEMESPPSSPRPLLAVLSSWGHKVSVFRSFAAIPLQSARNSSSTAIHSTVPGNASPAPGRAPMTGRRRQA